MTVMTGEMGLARLSLYNKRKALATPFFVICISSSHSFFKASALSIRSFSLLNSK